MSSFSLRYGIAAGILVAASAAQAADIPVKAVAPVIAVYNWTGIYGGIQGGYGRGMKEWLNNGDLNYDVSGFFAGGTIGLNQQIGNWVIGLEADAAWANLTGSQTIVIGAPGSAIGVQSLSASTSIDSIVTATGRLGFAQDRWLVYIKAGAAWARETHTANTAINIRVGDTVLNGAVAISGSETRFGPVFGIGAEHAFYGNWSFKSEYNYLHFLNGGARLNGITTVNGVSTPIATDETIRQGIHLAKFGLNYRFGPSSPPAIAPARPAPGYDWTGFYVGVEGGGGFGTKTWEGVDVNPFDVRGWFAGGVTGTNVQAGVFVVGAESEVLFSGIRGSGSSIIPAGGGTQTTNISTRVDWMSLNSLRVGFVAADRWLLYFKGGVALAKETHTSSVAAVAPGASAILNTSGTALHTGALVGAGVEYAFLGNWSAKLEYNYINFQTVNATLNGLGVFNIPQTLVGTIAFGGGQTIDQDMHLIKIGLNYKFGSFTNIISAKY